MEDRVTASEFVSGYRLYVEGESEKGKDYILGSLHHHM